MSVRRLIAALAVALLAVSACAENKGSSSGGAEPSGELIVQVASYDVTVGQAQRVILGLLMPDQRFVSFGEVDVEFFYLGTKEGQGKAQPGPTTTASFLPVPGEDHEEPADSDRPVAGPASRGRGVYATEVEFDRAGFWSAQVTADVANEGALTGNSVFEVAEDAAVPAVGERALRTDNLTLNADDAPIGAIDSRAVNTGKVPDEELHRTTIRETIDRGEPAVVVFATPVYCVSRFCGPITDMIEDLAREYDDRANFIHVEKQVVNKGAADWLLHGGDLSEPWVFFIDDRGVIRARWDNVATASEIEPYLEDLPRL